MKIIGSGKNEMIIHYYEDQDQMRRRLKSGGNFRGGPLCGNGDAHASITQDVSKVTCKACMEKIKPLMLYYQNS